MSYWYPLSIPTFTEEEIGAATRVLRSGWTTMGRETEVFEAEFASYVGVDQAVMVNSGSSADLLIAFALLGEGLVQPGDEVLCPAVTWPTQLWAWRMAGLNVQLVDVNRFTLNAGPDAYSARLTAQTRVLSTVHLMGLPAQMDALTRLARLSGLLITEDCCEALGASYRGRSVGGYGAAAAWSFFFAHHMTTMEGGMVTTNDAAIADRLRSLRAHGWTRHLPPVVGQDPRYTFAEWGFNVRPTEVAAAIGRVQLARLPEMNRAREETQAKFAEFIQGSKASLPKVLPDAIPAWFGLPLIVHGDRDRFRAHLETNGVETRPILGGNLARQPVAHRGYFGWGALPGADIIHDQGLYVGLHPDPDADMGRLAEIIHSA